MDEPRETWLVHLSGSDGRSRIASVTAPVGTYDEDGAIGRVIDDELSFRADTYTATAVRIEDLPSRRVTVKPAEVTFQ